MMESIIKDKCDAPYCDGTSWRHYDSAFFANNGFIQEGEYKSEPENYRPDSLTRIICKMTEYIIKVKCDATNCDGTSWRH